MKGLANLKNPVQAKTSVHSTSPSQAKTSVQPKGLTHPSSRAGLLLVSLLLLTLVSCHPLRKKSTLADTSWSLVNQDQENVLFPDDYRGKLILISYVYTYCPDICPMITYNMRDVQRAFPDEDRLMLLSVSFDPERDTPEILKSYAASYKLNLDHWDLLTGDPRIVKSLLERTEIRTLKTPTTFTDDGGEFYFIDHTDKITLIDEEGFIRKNYSGSELELEKVIEDIKILLNDTK